MGRGWHAVAGTRLAGCPSLGSGSPKNPCGYIPNLLPPSRNYLENPPRSPRNGVIEVFTAPHGDSERDKMVAQYQALELAIEPITTEVARKAEPASRTSSSRKLAWLPQEATLDPEC